MKKLLLLSTVALLAACGSNNSSTPAQQTTTVTTTTAAPDLKTFNFTEGNLAVKAPSKWVKISQLKEAALELAGHTQKAYLGFRLIKKDSTIATNLDDVAQLGFEGSATTMGYNETLDIKSETLANLPARYTQFKHNFQGSKLEVLLYVIDNGDNYIFTVVTAEEATYPKISGEIKSIINSIHKP